MSPLRGQSVAQVIPLAMFGVARIWRYPTIEAAAEGGYGADPQVAPAALGAGERLMLAIEARAKQLDEGAA